MFVASRKQMQKIDEILLKTYTIETLVDKASDCLLEEVKDYSKFVIVCGSGNNGADGYSLALKLHALKKHVVVYPCKLNVLSPACQYYLSQCYDAGILMNFENTTIEEELEKCDVCIDAIFGFGCHSNPEGIFRSIIRLMNQYHKTISIDVPSGLNCDTGEVYENCVHAFKTITFFAYKLGFFYPSAKKVLGEVIIKRLNVHDFSNEISIPETINTIQIKKRKYDGHKYTYGRSFLICGSESYHGASLLATSACVHTGCGLTCLCSNEQVLHEASIYVPEAIHTRELDSIRSYQSILIGCGLENGEKYLKTVLQFTDQPLVIDASSLNDLSKHLDWLENQNRTIILTPHAGEFKRLCLDAQDLTTSAIEFAKKYHVIVVLKGPNTLITDGIHSYRNTTGNANMAIGGCGDVLSGIITSLLAQGYSGLEAAKIGVYLHGYIADEIAKEEYSVLPSKIISMIPKAMKKFEVEYE